MRSLSERLRQPNRFGAREIEPIPHALPRDDSGLRLLGTRQETEHGLFCRAETGEYLLGGYGRRGRPSCRGVGACITNPGGQPTHQPPFVIAVRADRHIGQGEDESGGSRRVQAAAQGRSRDDGDGALELRERAERAPIFGDRRERSRPSRRAGDRLEVGNLSALERRRQHGVGTGGTDRIDAILGGLGRHPPKPARREQHHRVPATLIVFAALEDLLAQPGEISRFVSLQRDASVIAHRFQTAVIGLVEDDVPKAARARDRWPTGGVHGEPGDEHRGIERRSREGALLEHAAVQHPLIDRVQTTRGFHPRGNVGRVEVESDTQLLRRQLRDGAKERCEAALA